MSPRSYPRYHKRVLGTTVARRFDRWHMRDPGRSWEGRASDLKTVAGIVAERQPERWEATLVWDGEGRGERRGRSFHLGISILQNEVLLAFLPFIRRPGR